MRRRVTLLTVVACILAVVVLLVGAVLTYELATQTSQAEAGERYNVCTARAALDNLNDQSGYKAAARLCIADYHVGGG